MHGPKPDWTTLEVVQQSQFIWPAGIGLVVVVLALLTDSPYAWVLSFAYFLAGVPGLIIYLRGRPRPAEGGPWHGSIKELDGENSIRAALEPFLDPNFAHTDEVVRAVEQCRQASAAYQALREVLQEVDEPRHLAAKKILAQMIARLNHCVKIFTNLQAADSGQLMRKMQSLAGKGRLSESDQVEHKLLQSKIAAREKMLSELIDALRANDHAIDELNNLRL